MYYYRLLRMYEVTAIISRNLNRFLSIGELNRAHVVELISDARDTCIFLFLLPGTGRKEYIFNKIYRNHVDPKKIYAFFITRPVAAVLKIAFFSLGFVCFFFFC